MSAPSTTDQPDHPDRLPARNGMRNLLAKGVAMVAVVAALIFGANAITNNGSSTSAATTNGTQGGPSNGAAGFRGGPGMGTPVTGATLTRLTSLVTAKYPGTVEQAMKLSDGSYEVHVIQSGGEKHVLVSKDFKITGVQTGGPPGGGAPPTGTAPGGSAPPAAPSGTTSSSSS